MLTHDGTVQMAFDNLNPGDVVRVTLQPASCPAWLGPDDDGSEVFADAHGHAVDPAVLAHLVRGSEIEARVVSVGDVLVLDTGTGDDDAIALAPAHVAHLRAA